MFSGYYSFSYNNGMQVLQSSTVYNDVCSVLTAFRFSEADLLAPGGGKSLIAKRMNLAFDNLGWKETLFEVNFKHEKKNYAVKTHLIDHVKDTCALEIEWNNKDTFFDRDLNHFRIAYNAGKIEFGVIVTRATELNKVFKNLVKTSGLSKDKYVSTTTHFDRLVPRLIGGASGKCPVVAFAITDELLENFGERKKIDI